VISRCTVIVTRYHSFTILALLYILIIWLLVINPPDAVTNMWDVDVHTREVATTLVPTPLPSRDTTARQWTELYAKPKSPPPPPPAPAPPTTSSSSSMAAARAFTNGITATTTFWH
jgi:hypothetical protein